MSKNAKPTISRNAYAEFCPYGIDTHSADDTLMIFGSAVERDEMVKRINRAHFDQPEGCARAIARKDARGLYCTQDIGGEGQREVNGLRTCYDRPFFEVGSKRGGMLC